MSEQSPDPQALAPDAKRALLARLLSERAAQAGTPAASPIDPIARVPRDRPLAASFAQHRLWFFDQLVPGTAVYNIHFGLRLRGPLDVAALERALSLVVERHEALRTRLEAAGGLPVQAIDPPWRVVLPVADLRHLPESDRAAGAERLATEEAARPFALAQEPLFRASLVRLAEEEHHLLVTVHHAVSDGWSASLVVGELAAAYAALARGVAPSLPPLPIQYADYAAWQRERYTAGDRVDRQLAYWRRRLAAPLPVLELPTDHPRPATLTFTGGTETRQLPEPLVAGLKSLGRTHGATLFMTLLAAFSLVLSRLSGDDDLVVGSPIAGRTRPETERVIGCFINTLPLRIDLAGAPTFTDLLGRVRATALEAYEHQDVPFERIAEEVQPGRDRSRSPVFQVLFNMLGMGGTWTGDAAGISFEALPALQEPSKFDLTVYAVETAGAVYVRAVYNRDLFEPARIAGLMQQFEQVLGQVAQDPSRPVAAYSLLTEAARRVLPDPAAPIEAVWPGSVLERLAAHARRAPDAPAIRHAGGTWSYADVERSSDAVAGDLERGGAGRGTLVAVCARRCPELVAALLGVWKAGAAFVVLDPAYPAARLAAILEAAAPDAWIDVGGDTPEALRPLAARFAEAARVRVAGHAETAPRAAASIEPDDLAYIAFTSGSTGTPKGILGTHGPVSHFLQWQHETFATTPADRCSLFAGLSHDPLLRDVFAPIWAGGTLHVPTESVFESGASLASWLRDESITISHITPALGERLAQGSGGLAPALRLVCFGGDMLAGRDVDRIRAFAPGARVVNFYGATETPQAMGWHEVPAGGAAPANVPIGAGIDGVQLLVLNGADGLAGVGELGEICVRTPYLAKGYLDGRQDAGRFTSNPVTGRAADRVYRTGDLGRYGPDGLVRTAGRRDAQVKVRGFRIELGEVESILEAHPDVRRAVVVVDGDSSADRTLRACCVTGPGALDVAALRAYLRARLPEPIVPSRFAFVDALPLTPNGKIDRRAAAALAPVEAVAARPFTPPSTPIEESVAALWRELLGVERVGRDDSFFELGGHSLVATRLTSRFHDAFGVVFPLRQLFEAPTLGAVALEVTERMLDAELADTGLDLETIAHEVTAGPLDGGMRS